MLQVTFEYHFATVIDCNRINGKDSFYEPEAITAMRLQLRRTLILIEFN